MKWFGGGTRQNETTPLIPKAGSDWEDVAAEGYAGTGDGPDQHTPPWQPDGGIQGRKVPPVPRSSLTTIFLKYFLFTSNLFFTVLGLLVLTLGLWGLISKESFAQERIGSIGTDPMLVFATLGLVLTVLCLLGCVGALRENCRLLWVFSVAVLVLVTAQVLAGIVAYSLQDRIQGFLRSGMLAAMERYQDDLDLRFIVDEIQTDLQCCGADNYRDWEVNMYYNCTAPGVLACGVPATCCIDPLENGTVWNSQCGVGAQELGEFSAQSVVFLGGCLGGMTRWINQHATLIGVVGIVILGVQVLTIFITTRLMDNIYMNRAKAAYALQNEGLNALQR